jgi:hypothetical protein
MARAKTKPKPEPDYKIEPAPEPPSEEFERFQEFAREIFNVPKSEIDRRQAEYEAQRPLRAKPSFKRRMIPPR